MTDERPNDDLYLVRGTDVDWGWFDYLEVVHAVESFYGEDGISEAEALIARLERLGDRVKLVIVDRRTR